MPGPRNAKTRSKLQAKKEKRTKAARQSLDSQPHPAPVQRRPLPPTPSPIATPPHPATPPVYHHTGAYSYAQCHPYPQDFSRVEDDDPSFPMPKKPFIEDPGNGPRVRDVHAFLASSFASTPSTEDPLCTEFAQEEVLQMLRTVLPDETATILWYNKSRMSARICPACQRLYRLGDSLQDPIAFDKEANPDTEAKEPVSENRYREQLISGLCSPLCFIMSAYNYPGAICSTYGRMAEDLSDETWDTLDGSTRRTEDDKGLGMLLKMTRCHDLGLGQLFFPGLDMDVDPSDLSEGSDDHLEYLEAPQGESCNQSNYEHMTPH